MTITLDDVDALLHLLIKGQFCPFVTLEFVVAVPVLVDLLGAKRSNVTLEMRHCRGPLVSLVMLALPTQND